MASSGYQNIQTKCKERVYPTTINKEDAFPNCGPRFDDMINKIERNIKQKSETCFFFILFGSCIWYSFHLWPFRLIHFIRRYYFHFNFHFGGRTECWFFQCYSSHWLLPFIHSFIYDGPQSVQICMLWIHSIESPPGKVAFVCVCHITTCIRIGLDKRFEIYLHFKWVPNAEHQIIKITVWQRSIPPIDTKS